VTATPRNQGRQQPLRPESAIRWTRLGFEPPVVSRRPAEVVREGPLADTGTHSSVAKFGDHASLHFHTESPPSSMPGLTGWHRTIIAIATYLPLIAPVPSVPTCGATVRRRPVWDRLVAYDAGTAGSLSVCSDIRNKHPPNVLPGPSPACQSDVCSADWSKALPGAAFMSGLDRLGPPMHLRRTVDPPAGARWVEKGRPVQPAERRPQRAARPGLKARRRAHRTHHRGSSTRVRQCARRMEAGA